MATLILTSILVATAVIPLVTSRDPSPKRGLDRAVIAAFLFIAAYLFTCLAVYNRL